MSRRFPFSQPVRLPTAMSSMERPIRVWPQAVWADGQTLIGRSIEDIAVGKRTGWLKGKRRLIEMACVDGAAVLDDNHLLAVGALVCSHPSVGNQLNPHYGRPLVVPLGRAADQGQLRRRRHRLLRKPRRRRGVRRGDEFPLSGRARRSSPAGPECC